MTDQALVDIVKDHDLATLATIRRDGRPQLSNVSYTYDPQRDLIRVSITDDRAKTANLRRDPRATLLVNGKGGWSYAAVDATATLLPVAQAPDDASVEELISIYRAIGGEHPDWDDYRAAMVADRRVPLHLHVDRIYGIAR
ncbi:PPOX class F420-dependent oxidoreductase [Flexivirga sp. ID2601S]|uniref:PPOX class F420-dependent oxidoreductase n=1 Tax=Flexivirga aerilata TaxID=1656889 RepID=A0A849APX5_9MICO|nr:PPOX class F420-dependent oxidoreductase [Flexivirga aerilata]NNG38832.1 PPOX class F420-dependent oxidoreductase [Flexivirga aerilata]